MRRTVDLVAEMDAFTAGVERLTERVAEAISKRVDGNFRLFVDVSNGGIARVQLQSQEDVRAQDMLDETKSAC